MNEKNTFKVYDSKTKEDLKRETDKIIRELELYGRSIHNRTQVNKVLSRRFGQAVKDNVLVFAWNRYNKKSIIVLHPSFRLIRLGNTHVGFLKRDEENLKK